MHIVKKYGEAAKRAQTCGFDAVEIHAGHSYLISQFLSPTTNKRTDEFGGSAENRARFAKLVIEEVRKQVGPFFPIFVRISADEMVEGGNTLEDTLEYLQYFEKEVDVFDVSCGLNSSIQYQIDANYLPDGWRSFMSKAVKEKYNKPCNVVVIGGGTASVISKIPDKKRLADFPEYLKHRASKLHNLFIFKNTIASVEFVKNLNPNIIVNATGSVPTLPPITGLHDLVDKDNSNVATVLKMKKYNVRQMTNTALQEVQNDRYIVKNPEGEIEEIPFDYGFVCLGMRANTPILAEIEEGRNILNVLARHDFL